MSDKLQSVMCVPCPSELALGSDHRTSSSSSLHAAERDIGQWSGPCGSDCLTSPPATPGAHHPGHQKQPLGYRRRPSGALPPTACLGHVSFSFLSLLTREDVSRTPLSSAVCFEKTQLSVFEEMEGLC